jgi:hypothetical protein
MDCFLGFIIYLFLNFSSINANTAKIVKINKAPKQKDIIIIGISMLVI